LEYGTYASCMASRAACRSASQSMLFIAGNDSESGVIERARVRAIQPSCSYAPRARYLLE
jgi:hypothetical protein